MEWTRVGALDALPVERAVAALVGTDQVAVVRLADGSVHAVGHHDPFSRANVMARGIVGSATTDGQIVRTLASPMYKQAFDLSTGECTSDPSVNIGVWRVRVIDGAVEVGDPIVAPTSDVPQEDSA